MTVYESRQISPEDSRHEFSPTSIWNSILHYQYHLRWLLHGC